MFVSVETIKGHLKNIYRKLNVSKRRQAAEKAQALGIETTLQILKNSLPLASSPFFPHSTSIAAQ
ncbi:MAG: hypothetical protein GY850_01580 [bacterium]|nr:hypothetical protein [bacterium]